MLDVMMTTVYLTQDFCFCDNSKLKICLSEMGFQIQCFWEIANAREVGWENHDFYLAPDFFILK